MTRIAVSVDVPDLAAGVQFYASAFGFTRGAEPVPGVAVMQAANTQLCLLQKRAGSHPAPGCADERCYEPHWTPVHLDLHVADFKAALARALAAGAVREQLFESAGHGAVAFCRDPFGHGFCLIENRAPEPT